MSLVAAGEIHQLNVLYQHYHQVLNGFFVNLGSDPQSAQDLTQETFLRILRYRESYREEFPFKAWMFRIARNVRFEHLKKCARQPETVDAFDEAVQCGFVESRDNRKEELKDLDQAIRSLNDEHREILYLARYEKLSYAEIGKILGCNANNVKIKVYRALEQLRIQFHRLSERIPS